MKSCKTLVATVAAFAFSGAAVSQAAAAPLTLNATNVVIGTLQAGSYTGFFDASQWITGQSTINSIKFSFSFLDDSSDSLGGLSSAQFVSTATRTEYHPGGGLPNKVVNVNTTTNNYTQEREGESATLQFSPSIVYNKLTGSTPSDPTTQTILGQEKLSYTSTAIVNATSATPCSPAKGNCKETGYYTRADETTANQCR